MTKVRPTDTFIFKGLTLYILPSLTSAILFKAVIIIAVVAAAAKIYWVLTTCQTLF